MKACFQIAECSFTLCKVNKKKGKRAKKDIFFAVFPLLSLDNSLMTFNSYSGLNSLRARLSMNGKSKQGAMGSGDGNMAGNADHEYVNTCTHIYIIYTECSFWVKALKFFSHTSMGSLLVMSKLPLQL